MLLRWLVNQYLRDAAEGKVRQVVTDIIQSPQQIARVESAPRSSDSRDPGFAAVPATPDPQPSSSTPEFLPCDVVFIFALGVESGGLVDLLKGAETSRQKHGMERAGKLVGREVVIVESGVGQKSAARATEEAIRFYQPRWVISAGFAGGLDEKLRRGHIVMADEVMGLTGDAIKVGLNVDQESVAGMKGLHVGRLLTVDGILRQPAERRRLAVEHQAIACDMESLAVAETCRKHGVPLMAIRVVSDSVEDELPPEIENLLEQKSVAGKLGAAAGAILKRFGAAKDLWKLREEALKASDRLAKFLVGVVEQLPNHS